MPSRNRLPNAAELVSRSLNCTRAVSPCERSDMVNASHHWSHCRPSRAPAYNEQIITRPRTRVQPQQNLWFPARYHGRPQKKEPPFPAALKLITGRRQTEWTGATRCPNEDELSHRRESLIDRKRAIFLKLRLPCRPLAECTEAGVARCAVGRGGTRATTAVVP